MSTVFSMRLIYRQSPALASCSINVSTFDSCLTPCHFQTVALERVFNDKPCVVWSRVASVVSAIVVSDCVVCDCVVSARVVSASVVSASVVASGVVGSSVVVS